jgi:hypothetical protein
MGDGSCALLAVALAGDVLCAQAAAGEASRSAKRGASDLHVPAAALVLYIKPASSCSKVKAGYSLS